jgi:hypothetical protein
MGAIVGCSSGGGDDTADPAAATSTAVPPPASGTGQLQFKTSAESDPDSTAGYVVGSQANLKVQKAGDTYYVNNVPPGQHDVIVTSGNLAVPSLALSSLDRGLRQNDLAVQADSVTTLGTINLPLAGSISGIVTLKGATDHSGIDVFIPGTDMIAKSDKFGKFAITKVPVGKHALQYQFQSFNSVVIADADGRPTTTVAAETNTEVKAVEMIPTVVQGFLKIADCDCLTTTSARPVVKISATTDAFQMRLSNEAAFIGISYGEFVAQFTLPETLSLVAGKNTIYLQLMDKTGVAGAITKNEITLTTGTPTPATESQVATPSSSVATGTFTDAQSVTLSAETGSTIYYTIDGTTPTTTSTVYSSSFTVACSISATTTVKAVAVKTGSANSPVLSVAMTFSTCPIVMFHTAAKSNSNTSGISGANTLCQTDKPASLSCTGTAAFLSAYTGSQNIASLNTIKNFTASRKVTGYGTGLTIVNAFSDIGNGNAIVTSIGTATNISDYYWTGSTAAGVALGDCTSWTGSTSGNYGSPSATDSTWLNAGSVAPCNSYSYYIMCLCY